MNIEFKPNGMRPSRRPLRLASRLTTALCATLLASLAAGCQTTQTGTTATSTESQCVAWRNITYSTKHDTPLTVEQIRVHNATGVRLGCWTK